MAKINLIVKILKVIFKFKYIIVTTLGSILLKVKKNLDNTNIYLDKMYLFLKSHLTISWRREFVFIVLSNLRLNITVFSDHPSLESFHLWVFPILF